MAQLKMTLLRRLDIHIEDMPFTDITEEFMKFHKSTFSLHIRCRLNPKNHSIDFLPLIASECLMN